MSTQQWAQEVLAVANSTPTGRYDAERIFISELHAEGQRRNLPAFKMPLEAFKARLIEANREGTLQLNRADLVGAMDPELVRESNTPHPALPSAVFNFVVSPLSAGAPTMARGAEAKSSPDLVVHYRYGQGILLQGLTKPYSDAIAKARPRWRWFRSMRQWGVARTKDRSLSRYQVEEYARGLQKVEVPVRVDYQEPQPEGVRDFDEVVEERTERALDRAERLEQKAERLEGQAAEEHRKAHAIMDAIPLGQPILVGHHSEGRHRRDIKRVDSAIGRAVEASDDAKRARRGARAAEDTAVREQSPEFALRRLRELAAESRELDVKITGEVPTGWRGLDPRGPATGEWLAQLKTAAAENRTRTAYYRRVLDGAGYMPVDHGVLRVGDPVITDRGDGTVTKLLSQLVEIRFGRPMRAGGGKISPKDYLQRLAYERVWVGKTTIEARKSPRPTDLGRVDHAVMERQREEELAARRGKSSPTASSERLDRDHPMGSLYARLERALPPGFPRYDDDDVIRDVSPEYRAYMALHGQIDPERMMGRDTARYTNPTQGYADWLATIGGGLVAAPPSHPLTVATAAVRPFNMPSEAALASARAELLEAGLTEEQLDVETSFGLRSEGPPRASLLVKVAAGALSIQGAKKVLADNAGPAKVEELDPLDIRQPAANEGGSGKGYSDATLLGMLATLPNSDRFYADLALGKARGARLIGNRDNHLREQHATALRAALARFKANGLRARLFETNGRPDYILVYRSLNGPEPEPASPDLTATSAKVSLDSFEEDLLHSTVDMASGGLEPANADEAEALQVMAEQRSPLVEAVPGGRYVATPLGRKVTEQGPIARLEYVDVATGLPTDPSEPGTLSTGRIVADFDGEAVVIDEEDLIGHGSDADPRKRQYQFDRESPADYPGQAASKKAARANAAKSKPKAVRVGLRDTFDSASAAAEVFYRQNEDYFDNVPDPKDGLRDWMDGIEVQIGRGRNKTHRKLSKTATGRGILGEKHAARAIRRALAYLLGQAKGRRWDAVPWNQVERLGESLERYFEAPDAGDPRAGASQRGIYWRPFAGKVRVEDFDAMTREERDAIRQQESAKEIGELLVSLRSAYERAQACLPADVQRLIERRIAEWSRWADDPRKIPEYACDPDLETGGYLCNFPAVAGELAQLRQSCEDAYNANWAAASSKDGRPGFPDTSQGQDEAPPPHGASAAACCSTAARAPETARPVAPVRRKGEPIPITSVDEDSEELYRKCGIEEVDRVLGGGLVEGTVLLLAGDPGAGKSTLVLQVAKSLACSQGPVLYGTGEETEHQVARRAKRLQARHERLHLLADSSSDAVLAAARKMQPPPVAIIVDSIQRMRRPSVRGDAGSLLQIRAVSKQISDFAKATGIPVVLIAHATKKDEIAGPKALQHDVDATLTLGLESDGTRILKTLKNRYGSTDELGRFTMTDSGLMPQLRPGTKAPTSGQYQRDGGSEEVTVVKGEPLPPTPEPGGSYSLVDATKHEPPTERPSPRPRKAKLPPPRPPVRTIPKSVATAALAPAQRKAARRVDRLACAAVAASEEAAGIDVASYRARVETLTAAFKVAEKDAAACERELKAAEREAARAKDRVTRQVVIDARCKLRLARGRFRQLHRDCAVAKGELQRAMVRKARRQEVADSRQQAANKITREAKLR